MNPWLILAVLLALAGLGSWGTYENGRADKWEGKYNSLQASYKTAAVAAETHAQAIQAQQQKQLDSQTKDALSEASIATSKANAVRAVYLKRLGELAATKPKDLPHLCAGVEIPEDLRP